MWPIISLGSQMPTATRVKIAEQLIASYSKTGITNAIIVENGFEDWIICEGETFNPSEIQKILDKPISLKKDRPKSIVE